MRLSNLEKLLFTKHVSVMTKAGITLVDALDTLLAQAESSSFKKILNTVLSDLKNGQKLSTALSAYPKVFDKFYLSLIKVGEESGTLDRNLEYLSLKLNKDHLLRQKIQGVLFYPAIVVTAAAVIGISLALFVLPKLSDLFLSLDVKLPLSTKILMFIASMMKQYNIYILIGLIVFVVLFNLFINLSAIKPYWHRFLLSLPVLGVFFQNVQISAFTRNLGIMLQSGLPITDSLEIVYDSTDNLVFKKYYRQLLAAIDRGVSIESEFLSGQYPKVPKIAVKMIGVGEKSGSLSDMLLYLGDYFESEIDNTAKNFSTILEPVLLLSIGLMVAFLALAIISPIYQLTGNISP